MLAESVIQGKGSNMSAGASGFGGGLGSVIGSSLASSDLSNAQNTVNDLNNGFGNTVQPDIAFGQSFLSPATSAINNLQTTAGQTQSYDDFMKNYTNTPAARYQLQQADAVQNNTAAGQGNLLSGANIKAIDTMNNGIISQNANTAYNEYLQGNSQQFGQLNTALGDMFNAIGVGTTATGQLAGLDSSTMAANANIAASQAKNDQSKGSGIGSMFSGLGGRPVSF